MPSSSPQQASCFSRKTRQISSQRRLGDLALKEAGSLRNIGVVGEVSRGDDQGSGADQVAIGAEDLGLVLGEVGDTAVVLRVAGVAVQDDALDLLLDFSGDRLDGPVDDCGALAVVREEFMLALLSVSL